MTDDEVLRRVCAGRAVTPATQPCVLYNDGRTALVRWPGGRDGHGPFSSRVSPWVDRYDLERPHVVLGIWSGRTVWDSDPEQDGRLTAQRLEALVRRLGLDPACLRRPAVR